MPANPPRPLWLLVPLAAVAAGIVAARPGAPPPVFRLGTQSWAGYAPAYHARADGAWPPDVVRTVELPTDAEIVRAMRSGALEAACLTLDGAFRVQAAGVEVRVLAVLDYSTGGDAVVAVRGGPAALAGLRGKRVGVERHGVGMLFLARALRTAGLRVGDITVVNADMPEHERLVAENRVDAVVTYSPRKERLVADGGRVLFDSARLPENVIDVLAVRADALAATPAAVRALARGWGAAADRLAADPAAHAAVARAMGLPPAEYAANRDQIRVPSRAESQALVAGDPPGLLAAARETGHSLVALGVLDGPLDADRLFLTPEEAEVLRR